MQIKDQKPNLKKPRKVPKENVICFDLESYQIRVDPTQFQIGVDSIEVYGVGAHDGDKTYFGGGKDAIVQFCDWLLDRKGRWTAYAHNVSYDAGFLWRELCRYSRGCTFEGVYTDDKVLIAGKIQKRGLKIKLGCTLFGDRTKSLKAGTKIIDSAPEKLTLDDYCKINLDDDFNYLTEEGIKKTFNWKLEQSYLKIDVESIPKILKFISNQLDVLSELSGGNVKARLAGNKIFSQAGAAFASLAEFVGSDLEEYKFPVDPVDAIYMKAGYFGGYTCSNSNHLRVIDKKIKYHDVNSFYPSIIVSGIPYLPYGFEKPKGRHVTWYLVRGSKVDYKKKYSFMTNKFLGNCFGGLDGFSKFYMLKEVYESICDTCDHDLEILERIYQLIDYQAGAYVSKLYEARVAIKERLKTTTSKIERAQLKTKDLGAKTVMNSLYGKFAQETYAEGGEINDQNGKLTRVDKTEYCDKCKKALDEGTEDFCGRCGIDYKSILTGAYITAIARSKLVNGIKEEVDNGNTFLYCDTDSITMIENVPFSFEINPSKLGALKCEGEFDYFQTNGKFKKYVMYNRALKKRYETDPELIGKDEEHDYPYVKYACSGVPVKDKLCKGSFEDLDTLYNEGNNVVFIGVKNISKDAHPEFGIPLIQKIDVAFNPTHWKTKEIIKPTHICRYPFEKLEKIDAA